MDSTVPNTLSPWGGLPGEGGSSLEACARAGIAAIKDELEF